MSVLLTVAESSPRRRGCSPTRSAPAIRAARSRSRNGTSARTGSPTRLPDSGLAKGDRVALLAYNCVEWMEIYVGARRARARRRADQLPPRRAGDRVHRARTARRARSSCRTTWSTASSRSATRSASSPAASSTSARARAPAGWQAYEAMHRARRRGDRRTSRRARGHVGADVHVGHDGPAEGRDPQPRGQRADLARHRARHGLRDATTPACW